MMDKDVLIFRLTLVLDQLEEMHSNIVIEAAQRGIEPKYLRTTSGEPALLGLFCAQANTLAALAQLQKDG